MKNAKQIRCDIKALGINPADFNVRTCGLCTDVDFKINCLRGDYNAAHFAMIEAILPYGKILLFDQNGTTCNWSDNF